MLGVISNPKKTFQIEKSSTDVAAAIDYIRFISLRYTLVKANPALNLFTYSATEFLSIGVYIDINYFTHSENRTEVTIEVRRKIGTFNQSFEVTLANNHIADLTDLLSKSLSVDLDKRTDVINKLAEQTKASEDARLRKIETAKERAREEKQNHPTRYYSKQAFWIVMTLALIATFFFLVHRMVDGTWGF